MKTRPVIVPAKPATAGAVKSGTRDMDDDEDDDDEDDED
jgi:hypothetical protein